MNGLWSRRLELRVQWIRWYGKRCVPLGDCCVATCHIYGCVCRAALEKAFGRVRRILVLTPHSSSRSPLADVNKGCEVEPVIRREEEQRSEIGNPKHWRGCCVMERVVPRLISFAVLCFGSLRRVCRGNARERYAWDPCTRLRQV